MTEVSSMFERRIPEVVQHIEADFEALKNGEEIWQDFLGMGYAWDYCFRGKAEKYSWQVLGLTSNDLLSEDGLRVFDLGCGAGNIVRHYNQKNVRANKAYGITACDYGVVDPAVIVGNVHSLNDLYPADLGPVDRAISQNMYMHLADPLSVLEMMARRVEKGGLMVVDRITLRADMGSMVASHVLKYLTKGSHFRIESRNGALIEDRCINNPDIRDGFASNLMQPMLLRRVSPTSSPIELPISYDINPMTETWQYFAV